MPILYGLRHMTSRRFLSVHPDVGAHGESPHVTDVVTFSAVAAELYRDDMGEFRDAWEIVDVFVPDLAQNETGPVRLIEKRRPRKAL